MSRPSHPLRPLKALGQGLSGCVVTPALSCASNIEVKEVNQGSKVQTTDVSKLYYNGDVHSDPHYKQDWELHKVLATIDPKRQYYLWGKQMCDVSEEDRNRAATQCNETSYGRKLSTKQIIMPRGANTLESWLHKRKAKGNPPTMEEVIQMLRNVVVGLSKLEEPKIIHGDIKAENIMVMPNKTTRLIDFFPVNKYHYKKAWYYNQRKYRDMRDLGTMLHNILSNGLVKSDKTPPRTYDRFITSNLNDKLPSDVLKGLFASLPSPFSQSQSHSSTINSSVSLPPPTSPVKPNKPGQAQQGPRVQSSPAKPVPSRPSRQLSPTSPVKPNKRVKLNRQS